VPSAITPILLERRARNVAQLIAARGARLGLTATATAELMRMGCRLIRQGRSAASVLDFVRRIAALPQRHPQPRRSAMPTAPRAIRITNISTTNSARMIVRDVRTDVPAGEPHTLAGEREIAPGEEAIAHVYEGGCVVIAVMPEGERA